MAKATSSSTKSKTPTSAKRTPSKAKKPTRLSASATSAKKSPEKTTKKSPAKKTPTTPRQRTSARSTKSSTTPTTPKDATSPSGGRKGIRGRSTGSGNGRSRERGRGRRSTTGAASVLASLSVGTRSDNDDDGDNDDFDGKRSHSEDEDDIYVEESEHDDDDDEKSDNYDSDPGDDNDDDGGSFVDGDDDDVVEVLPPKSKSKARPKPTTDFQTKPTKPAAQINTKTAARSSIKATKTAVTKPVAKKASTVASAPKTLKANGKPKPRPKGGSKILPIPKGWPVTSNSSYPSPREYASTSDTTASIQHDGIDEDTTGNTSSKLPCNYLKPGATLQQSCNGSDVFLRKRAVQSTSMAFPSSSGAGTANKGGPTRFLIVFPGRLSLKSPEISVTSTNGKEGGLEDDRAEEKKEEVVEIDGDDDDDDEQEVNDDIVEADGKRKSNDDTEEKSAKTPRTPFAPTHPPQLLGKLVSLGGEGRKIELRVPFPTSNAASRASECTAASKQLIFSGRAIPLSGKYISLSFKRTGGGGGKVDTSPKGPSSHSNKNVGVGSIMCKDIFRSVIVLGESQVKNGEADDEGVEEVEDKQAVECNHYGGSERTLDGGGPCWGGTFSGKKSFGGRNSLIVTTKGRSHFEVDESEDDSENSISLASDIGDDGKSELCSDDEFVPTSVKNSKNKRRSDGRKSGANTKEDIDDDEKSEEVPKRRQRTPRRSASSAKKVNYADEASDVDVDSQSSGTGDDGSDEEAEEDMGKRGTQNDNDDDDGDDSDADVPKNASTRRKTSKKLSTTKNDTKTNNMSSQRKCAGKNPRGNVTSKSNDTKEVQIPKWSQNTSRRSASSAKKVNTFDEPSDMEMDSKSGNIEADGGGAEGQRDNGDEEDRSNNSIDSNADATKTSAKSKTGKSGKKSLARKSGAEVKEIGSGVDEMQEAPKRIQRTPRRSASSAKKVNYADEASDADMDSKTSDKDDNDGDADIQRDNANGEDRNGDDDDESDADYKNHSGTRSKKKIPAAKTTSKVWNQQRKPTKSSPGKKKDFVVIDSDDDFSVDRDSFMKPSISISPSRTSTAIKGNRSSKRTGEKKASNEDVIEIDSVSTATKSSIPPSKTKPKPSKNTSPSPRKRRKSNTGKLSPLRSKTKGWDSIDDDQYKFL